MTKLQKSKKGFTLTELAIVIAVIAILIAVLVPTFTSLINKANESADKQLVKNLNTAITIDDPENETQVVSEALEIAQNNGYTLSKISPTSDGYDIVWDEVSNRFVLMNDTEVVYYDSSTDTTNMELWYITNSSSILNDGKNYYYSADSGITGEVTVYGGADLSALTGVTKVTLDASSASQSTVITVVVPETALEVSNTNSATIKVYGSTTTISGTYGMYSLHVYGEVTGKIELSAGKVVAETGSDISSIIITASNINDIAIEAKSSDSIKSVGATNDTVATALSSSSQISGVSSSAVVTTAVSNAFAGGTGTEESPYQIATAEQFANIADFSDAMKTTAYYFELTDNINLTEINISEEYISEIFNGVLEGNSKTITCASGLTSLFLYAMDVTEFNNFTVAWSRNNITRVFLYEGIYAETYSDGIYVTKTEVVGVSYNNVDFEGVKGIIYKVGGDNSALYFTNSNYWFWDVIRDNWNTDNNLVVISGRTETASTPTSMVAHTQTIINCDVNANLTCTGYSAVFSGGQCYFCDTVISNCSYTGTFQGTKPSLIFANASGYDASNIFSNSDSSFNWYWGKVTVEDIVLDGNIIASDSGGGVYFATSATTLSGITQGEANYTLISEDSTLALTTSNSQYVITPATTTCGSYYIQLHLGKVYWYDSTYISTNDESSDMLLTIEVSTNNVANTGVYKAIAISLVQAKNQGIVSSDYTCKSTSIEGSLYSFVQYNDTWYIIIDVADNYGLFASTENQCTAYVYGVTDSLPVCQSEAES